jgi:hypothetical protein
MGICHATLGIWSWQRAVAALAAMSVNVQSVRLMLISPEDWLLWTLRSCRHAYDT